MYKSDPLIQAENMVLLLIVGIFDFTIIVFDLNYTVKIATVAKFVNWVVFYFPTKGGVFTFLF
jgi:hypothetical protein